MSNALTPCVCIEERTLSIGFGIKRAPWSQECRPQSAGVKRYHSAHSRSDEVLGANVRRDLIAVPGFACGLVMSRSQASLSPISKFFRTY
jgi:hypothetical protein